MTLAFRPMESPKTFLTVVSSVLKAGCTILQTMGTQPHQSSFGAVALTLNQDITFKDVCPQQLLPLPAYVAEDCVKVFVFPREPASYGTVFTALVTVRQ